MGFDGQILNWKLALLYVVLKENDHATVRSKLCQVDGKIMGKIKHKVCKNAKAKELFKLSRKSRVHSDMKHVYIEILSEFSIHETIF